MTADEIFRATCKGYNIFTPDIIRRGLLAPNVAYELAEGRGMTGKPIFGVSVRGIDAKGNEDSRYLKLSALCQDRQGAENFIDNLRKEVAGGWPA